MQKATGQPCPAAIVTPATDTKFGDYQSNGVMALAKTLKTNPRSLAERVLEEIHIEDICQSPQIAGPGFINLSLRPEFLAAKIIEIYSDPHRLSIDKTQKPKTVVVDFSGPNIAKQMHVGHLRSSIIGDCICRLLVFAGHTVIRQNHIGDWGTQFGMLCALLNEKLQQLNGQDETAGVTRTLADLEAFYKEAKSRYDTDEQFSATAREAIRGLHNGQSFWINEWHEIVNESRKHYLPIYQRLKVNLTAEDERGESFYKDMLSGVVDELKAAGQAVESDGAICVFPEGFENKQGKPLPFIIQKSDGAFLYATTDLAALKYRINNLGADHIIYVTDARQKLHFEMLFATARVAGWAGDNINLEHITFGSVMGEDGKPFKTRSGENVKLSELLDEAGTRAKSVVEQKNPNLPDNQKELIANAVGIGAVKYSDLSNNRTSDYIFSFDKMLAMEGNTAPYMQYAYARIKSIQRKAVSKNIDYQNELDSLKTPNLTEPEELTLAKHLLRYAEIIETATADFKPNVITAYLYELAQKFSTFYNACPVLIAPPDKRPTRLLLCDLTARTTRHGLSELLGIDVIEQM